MLDDTRGRDERSSTKRIDATTAHRWMRASGCGTRLWLAVGNSPGRQLYTMTTERPAGAWMLRRAVSGEVWGAAISQHAAARSTVIVEYN